MKKIILHLIVATIVTTVFLALAQTVVAEPIYMEDFESYSVGSFPSDEFDARWGGWSVAQEGENKFLRSTSSSSNFDMITRDTFPDNVVIEYDTRHSSSGVIFCSLTNQYRDSSPNDFSISMSTDNGSYSMYYHYTLDGSNYVVASETLGTTTYIAEPNTWYHTKLTLVEGLATLYFDDQYIFEYDFGAVIPISLENFHMYFMTLGQRDIDNIRVDPVPEPTTILLLSSGILSLAGFRRKFKKT